MATRRRRTIRNKATKGCGKCSKTRCNHKKCHKCGVKHAKGHKGGCGGSCVGGMHGGGNIGLFDNVANVSSGVANMFGNFFRGINGISPVSNVSF